MAMNEDNAGGMVGSNKIIGLLVVCVVGLVALTIFTFFDRFGTNRAISKARDQGDKALVSGDSVRALIAYSHARDLRPSDPGLQKLVWQARARFLAENADRVTLENLEESRYELEILVDEEPKNATYLTAYAHVLERRGENVEADKKLSEAVASDPKSVLAHLARAAFLQKTTNKVEAAVAEYNAVLGIDPNNFVAHYNLGRLAVVKKDSAKEIEELKKATTIDPNNYAAHEALGDAYLHKGPDGMVDALKQYSAAASLQPTNPEPHWGLGMIMSQAGRWKEAEAELRMAMKGKRYPEMEFQLGLAIAHQERCAEALPLFLQFIREEPGNAAAFMELGACSEKLGNKENAAAFYKKVLDMPPGEKEDPKNVAARNDKLKAKIASLGVPAKSK